jgi:putative membrane protein
VPQAEWQAAVNALIAHMRDGRIADGFVTAVERCGDKLAANFPRAGASVDGLPDRIYVI